VKKTLEVIVGAACLAALAGCDEALITPSAPPPGEEVTAAAPRPSAPEPSEASRELERFYARVEANLLAQGLLRTDGGGPDTPVTADDLARNFERIALYEEYANVGGRLVAQQTESRLHRWERPVQIELEFGDRVPEAKRNRDRVSVTAFASRLARVTGVPVRMVRSGGNFHVLIVNEEDRRMLGPRLRALIPGITKAALDTVIDLPRSSYCLVFAWDPDDTGTYEKAVAVIRAEHPDLLRLSCIHEEIAQGMGLSNDSPTARPSVFNDDEEFGLLTYHDELLLKILYDRRLSGGMTAQEAMPIVRQIAAELMAGDS
jgi:hypothetical protein